MPLIYLSCAWITGILLGAKFSPPLAIVLAGLIPLPLLFRFHNRRRPVILTSLCIIAFLGGVIHYQSSLPATDRSHLQFYNDQGTIAIRGIVNSDPEVSDKSTHLRLAASEINAGEEWQPVSGMALIFVPHYPAYNYGDVLQVTGRLETPTGFEDFDYKNYLAHQEIYSTMLYPEIEVLDSGKGLKPLEWIYSLRSRLSQSLAQVLPEPQASVAQAILLGIRGMIPAPLKTDFTRSGTAHLLVISGLHLTILAGILLSLGVWIFGRRHYIYIWLTLGMIWLYALLTGMNPPVIRATIMVSLFLTAELLGRQRSAFTALAFAAAIMIGISPQILWQASFQMSFTAMAGLILIYPHLQAAGKKAVSALFGEEGTAVSLANTAADSLSVTLAAILAVWPLVAYYFGIVSLSAPLATFFTLPVLPGIVIAGFPAGVAGLIALPVAQVVAWVAWLFLSYLILVINVFARFPASFVETGPINISVVLGYYLLLAIVIWLNNCHRRAIILKPLSRLRSETITGMVSHVPVKWVIPPMLVVSILVSITAITMPDNKLRISFLDVGQGDAILIHRGCQQVLIDGGPSPQAIGMVLGKKMPFWDRTINLVILTHPHADHLTGLVTVLQNYHVKQVLYTGSDYQSPLYDEFRELIAERNIEFTTARAGQLIDPGNGTIINVLNPQLLLLADTEADIDGNGIVLHISMDEVSFLLTTDIPRETEFKLAHSGADLRSTVLKVGHHGSETSTTEEFLAVVNPLIAVISVGADNPHGHPSPEVMERLQSKLSAENIYRTDEQGTIEFITNGKRLWVKIDK